MNREYQELFLVSKRTASNDLSELTAHRLLVVEGAGRATRYRWQSLTPDCLILCPIVARLGRLAGVSW